MDNIKSRLDQIREKILLQEENDQVELEVSEAWLAIVDRTENHMRNSIVAPEETDIWSPLVLGFFVGGAIALAFF